MIGGSQVIEGNSPPLFWRKALSLKVHQRKKLNSLILRSNGMPASQRQNDQFDLIMCQVSLIQAMQFATQNMGSQSQRPGQFLLLPPCLPSQTRYLLTKLVSFRRSLLLVLSCHQRTSWQRGANPT